MFNLNNDDDEDLVDDDSDDEDEGRNSVWFRESLHLFSFDSLSL